MAPEYAIRGHLTDMADIYSFCVVALEIVSGNRNRSCREEQEFYYLVDWVIRNDFNFFMLPLHIFVLVYILSA